MHPEFHVLVGSETKLCTRTRAEFSGDYYWIGRAEAGCAHCLLLVAVADANDIRPRAAEQETTSVSDVSIFFNLLDEVLARGSQT